jgi:phage terminase small subunit
MKKKLSPKQRRFISEYLKDQNATAAAKRAGYSAKTAEQQGSRLLGKVQVRKFVDAALKKIGDEATVDAKYILEALKEIAERCMQRIPVMMRDPGDGRKFIQKTDLETGEGVWEFDSMGANKAVELLGKHIRFFPAERREITGKDGQPLVPPPAPPDLSGIPMADLVAHIKARGASECAPHS